MSRLAVFFFACSLSSLAPGVETKSLREYLKGAREKADQFREKGEWEEAATAYRRILFVNPRDSTARRRLREINSELSDSLVEVANTTWERDGRMGLRILQYAHRVDPGGKLVQASFKDHGYSYKNGAWFKRDQLKNLGSLDRKRGEERREELGLGEEFAIIRQGVFRLFTDIQGGEHKLKQMLAMIQTHYQTYLGFMSVFLLRHPAEGLDIVFFKDEEDFQRATESDAVGMYMPGLEASFFFLTGEGDDFNTLMHELTHQMNDRVLHAWGLPPWFDEGIAEYFGTAFVTRGGRKIELGRATGYRLVSFLEAVRTRGAAVIPMRAFLDAEDTQISDLFHAQAWALAQYLFHGPPPGRLIAHDILATAIERADLDEAPLDADGLERILSSYGLTLDEFENSMIEHYRKGKAK